MDELDRDLKTLDSIDAPDLWQDITRRPPGPRLRLPSPGRRAAIAVFSLALSMFILVWAAIAFTGSSPDRFLGGPGSSGERMGTVFGVGVTFPSSWTLVDLWPLANSLATWPDPVGSKIDVPPDIRDRGGLPVLQLSNHDLGLASACTATGPTGDQAMLYVAVNGGPYLVNPDGSPRWSRDLTPGDGPCGQGLYAYREATSVAAARPYLVFAGFGPEVSGADRQVVMDAFASLSFAFAELLPPAEHMPGYVLDGLQLAKDDYTLEARPSSGGGVDLSLANGLRPDAGPIALEGVGRPGDPDLQFTLSGLLKASPTDTCQPGGLVCWVVFGVVSDQVASVEVQAPTVGTFQAPILPLPASLGASFGAFDVAMTPVTGATVDALDESGQIVAGEPLGQAAPILTPQPELEAQSALRNALAAALIYFTDGNTFVGFDPTEASSIEPSLTFNTSSFAREGEVSIRDMSRSTILLVTQSSDGVDWCIANDIAAVSTTYGEVDAKAIAECDGDISVWG